MLLALATLPIPYVICAWVLAPMVYLIVLLIDIDAPKSLRHLVPLAFRVASEVPFVHRVVAVLVSGAVLIGPAAVAAYVAEGTHNKITSGALTGLLTVPLFIPVASALLVSSYSKVRHDLDSYQGRLPNFPAGLTLLTVVTLATSALAVVATGFNQPENSLILALTWLAIVAALFRFLSAHRIRCLDPMKEGAPPGKRALEGVLHRGKAKSVFVSGNGGFIRRPRRRRGALHRDVDERFLVPRPTSSDPLTWMIVCEVGFDTTKDVLAHSRNSGAEIASEGREQWVRTCRSGH